MAEREKHQSDDPANTFRILVATDNHVGYMERDSIRGNDSIVTFEEILELANYHEADFILLGGDLFHDNKPSRKSIHGVMSLMRRYCVGQRPCHIEFLSDQAENFPPPFPVVNFDSPDYNIAMPIFSIHGNHDDPTGDGGLSSMDLLSVSGLVNYFGRTANVDDITISPLLMRKGKTKLALYGLGSIRDERLHRTFLRKNVKVLRPREDTEEWFNLFTIHQNRSRHGKTNYIPEQFLDNFLDLVVWGHEHECLITPEMHPTNNFFLTQPGSSVATSLSEGEAVPKHVALVEIKDKQFNLHKLPLRTVRPFIMSEVVLAKTSIDPNKEDKVNNFLTEKVKSMIAQAADQLLDDGRDPMKPLIRLKVEYSGGFSTLSSQRFGQQFVDEVANPRDLLLFHRKKQTYTGKSEDGTNLPVAQFSNEQLDSSRVEDLVSEFITKSEQMRVLSSKALGLAVKEYVDKDEKEAISEFVKYSLNQTQSYLKQRKATETDYLQLIQHRNQRMIEEEKDEEEVKEVMKSVELKRASQAPRPASDSDSMSDDDGGNASTEAKAPRGRGARGGRGRGSRGGKAASASTTTTTSTRGGRGSRARGRGRGAAATSTGIEASFQWASARTSQKQQKIVIESDSDDLIDDDDDFGRPSAPSSQASRATTSAAKPVAITSRGSSRRKANVTYDDEDDSDPFSMDTIAPAKKKMRRG